MALVKYKKKRNFRLTPEPAGKIKSPGSQLAFVVQRHKATRLHYDFRLELDGVLKSWAVPKGPSLNPGDKRLAIMVEDHPYDYKNFEGTIPEGNYGAGIVEIWDSGYYTDAENSDKPAIEKKIAEGLKKGNLKFRLYGKKLKGEFALVKLHSKNGRDNAWLLIKHKDKYAADHGYDSEEHTSPGSPINKALKKKAVRVQKKLKKYLPAESRKLHSFIRPMLARMAERPFDGRAWVFEIKWDGYRAIAETGKNNVLLYSRSGKIFNESYPVVVQELKKMNINGVLDGEIAVTDEKGRPSFQLLQNYSRNAGLPIYYYVFDLLQLNGKNTCGLPLLERKQLLSKIIKKNAVIKYSDHITEKGKAFFRKVKKLGMEGIIAKKTDSEYYPGKRTSEWLKIKYHLTGEAVIAGFTVPTGARKYFGALVLGAYSGDDLRYIGHTGSGFNSKSLKEIVALLKPIVADQSPFGEKVKTNMPVTWVKPVLVCEIKFSEWTQDGHMRHPIFIHLRPDKSAKEITMASEKPVTIREIKKAKRSARSNNSENKKGKSKIYSFGSIHVNVTNSGKIFWPDEGITKGDVIDYYQDISDFIIPYLKGRPQSLKRNPNGLLDEGFFQKDAGEEAPEWVKSKKIYSESAEKEIDYIICDNQATLTYLNNLGCIEINPWHSTVDQLDRPDYLVIDIDPSDANSFEEVIETAQVIHELLEKAKAQNFCKTSGARGMHVYIPLEKKYTYDQVRDFAQLICTLAHEQLPKNTSLERNLKARGKKIYLDYLQNKRGQTIACAYSLRPRPGATVSAPLEWKEVKSGLSPALFTIRTMKKRISKKGDLFKGILGKGISLEKCLKELEK